MAIAVDNLADAESLTTIEKENGEEEADQLVPNELKADAMIDQPQRKSIGSKGSRRSLKSLKKRRNTQLRLDIEAASGENLMIR